MIVSNTEVRQSNVPIMVAPNGARLTQSDHPAIPVTVEQTIDCALACKQAGAHALHAHVRDANQRHLLDVNAYQQLLNRAKKVLGNAFPVQITTEAFGIYSAPEQISLVKELKPRYASIAMREIIRDEAVEQARDFYHWCAKEHVGVQHILYAEEDVIRFYDYKSRDVIPATHNAVIIVVGRYTEAVLADTKEALSLAAQLESKGFDYMMCAFGKTETQCLQHAASHSGGVRVGFENNTEQSDGSQATSNEQRVSVLVDAIGNDQQANVDDALLHRMLGGA